MQTNPVKAIREKCLECSCGNSAEVQRCTVESCALYPFRFGKNPYRTGRKMTDEEKERFRTRMEEYRKAQQNTDDFEETY